MKDATFYVLSQIYGILNGNVSGSVYSIEQPHNGADDLFVRLTSAFSTKNNTKDAFYSTYVVNIDVVNRVRRNLLSYQALTTLSNEVSTLLNTTVSYKPFADSVDFTCVYAKIVDTTDFTDESDNDYLIRRVITLETLIRQL